MAQLAEIPTVAAVKQANADLEQARRIVELGLDLYAGDDDLVLPFLELGAHGGVCVHTHVVGPQVKELRATLPRRRRRRRPRARRGAASVDRAPAGRRRIRSRSSAR